MNSILSRALKDNTPVINHELVSGIAKPIFNGIPEYLNQMIKISLSKLNTKLNFKYLGYRFVTPEEELMEDAYSKASGKNADIAQNNVYLCCYEFSYNGISMPKYIYLPYAEDCNIFTISGTHYVVMPVLTDLVLSVKPTEIFVRLHRDKITVQSDRKRVILDDADIPDMPKVIYTQMLNGGDKTKTNVKTPFALYLLAKYGLDETLDRYCGLTREQFNVVYDPYDKITLETNKDYSIYSSVGERPKSYEKSVFYRKQKIKVLLHKDVELTPLVNNLVSAIILSFDMVPGNIEEDMNTALVENNRTREIYLWRLLLGKAVYKPDISINKITDDVYEHIAALDGYVDEIIKRRLGNVGVKIDDFWDLVAYIISIYANSVNNAKEYNRNINNVYLDLYYYICYDIFIGFNKVVKQLNQRFDKCGGKPPSKDEVKKLFNVHVSTKSVFNLIKSSSISLALGGADISNDSYYYKGTALLENQNRGDGVRKGGKNPFPDNVKTLTSYMLAFGSLLYLIKKAPTPTLRANPWGKFDFKTGHIVIDTKLKPAIEKLDYILRGISNVDEQLKEDLLDEEADNIIDLGKEEGVEHEYEHDDSDDTSEDSGDDEE